jgi:hypothetical protein
MAASKYPRSVRSGPLSGMTFLTEEEYQEARRGLAMGPDKAPVAKKPAKPRPAFNREMVAALVKMIEGLTSFIPSFRGAPFTDQENKWLVGDWYDFGKGNPWFRGLVETLFGLSADGKLIATHLAVFGARVVTHEIAVDGKIVVVPGMVPEAFDPQVRMLASLAFMGRLAMEGEAVADTIGLETGRAPGPDRENGVGEDLSSAQAFEFAGSYDPPGYQA